MLSSLGLLLLLLTANQAVNGFYLPGVAPRSYQPGESVDLKVNRLTSTKTQLAFDYYDLPFFRPEVIINAAENLGEILTGNKIENTAYELKLYQEESCKILGRKVYTKEEVAKFKAKIDEDYTVNLMADGLPAATHVPLQNSQSTYLAYDHGYHVGGTIRTTGAGPNEAPKYYLNNHIRITVFFHQPGESEEARIVGLEVEPFSINHEADSKKKWDDENPPALCQNSLKHKFDDDYPQKIKLDSEKNSVVWTYDVRWESSEIKWASRWDLYLSAGTAETAEVHWFSIINSLLIVLFLSGMVAMILVRTLHRDLNRYNRVLTDEEKAEELEETGWKLVHGDVFRPPSMPMLFSVTVGSGVQTFGMGVVTLFFSAIGFLSPANRGMLMIALLLLWVFMGIFAGYNSARTFKMFNGKEWQRSTLMTALFYPGIIFTILFILNLIVWAEGTTSAVPFGSLLAVLALWFLVSVPLTFLGAFFGFRRDVDKFPVQTQDIPRQIPAQPWYMSGIVTVLVGGILPFGAVFVELFFILTTLWLDSFYYVYGFLVLVFLILVITCAEISVVLCYFQLCGEDYRWWWRSMFTSGSSALYVFLYSLHWYSLKLHATRFVTHVLFFGYMSTLSLLFFLGTAVVGYFASFWFVWKIFASVKVD
jgi:transmembrane 9 superfamily protein 2/4